ncbi:CotY/CotZ family spore coat protein [Bacillus sp. DX1.1]|uniref:CotY/CotZ family spore coat protein n=1 Tax=unclassified Bacillus (in: firmicutes) TaxID=185979 RepID=UPI0025706723|nr:MULTISPECIES: CotY/CotZ family spore coat protein [unclassified Bacillus (in: firmicutes)]MDM5153863.1 CotY/CotZ family spore coat protein [Bacillus sp. DX1.1]WJE82798.1 CotY/CotZ family spore coat protein [Bacillus sp. DX3.1]
MNCNDKPGQKSFGCVCDVVKFIDELQSACVDFICTSNCFNPMLGMPSSGMKANTRVFSLYSKDATIFVADFLTDNCTIDSSEFFRVESVDDCCAVLRVLKLEDSGNLGICKFNKTDQCIIVDLNCFCAIACVEDTVINGV